MHFLGNGQFVGSITAFELLTVMKSAELLVICHEHSLGMWTPTDWNLFVYLNSWTLFFLLLLYNWFWIAL